MAKILITGDFCPIGRTSVLGQRKEYNLIYNDFLSVLEKHDFRITNLECPVGGKCIAPIRKTGPNLRAEDSAFSILKYGGFDLVTLANNHILDYGEEGLLGTIEQCEKWKVGYVGAGFNLDVARRFYSIYIDGLHIAILNFAENEFSTTHSAKQGGANPLNPVWNYYDILNAKKVADYVFVIVHGGHEGYQLPSPRMQETYRFFIDAGADMVIGHHPHCFSGFEEYHGKMIFYSLGNFIFDSRTGNREGLWTEGFALSLILSKDKLEFTIYPYEQSTEHAGIRKMIGNKLDIFNKKLLSLNRIIDDKNLLKSNFDDYVRTREFECNSLLQPYSNRILIKLFKSHLFPNLFSDLKKLKLLNYVRCESHRDVLINFLKAKTYLSK